GTMLGVSYLFGGCSMAAKEIQPELILRNARIATLLGGSRSFAQAVAIQDGRFFAVGFDEEIMRLRGAKTEVIDLGGRTVIPGLNDSHMHPIRGGLNYNMELRWDGVPSLADALRMLKHQAARTPAPQWVRVVGGWTEFQFAERRMPTLEEINAAAPEAPVFVLHLYDRAYLNGAALRACGYTKDIPDPPGGEIQRDKRGNPTGLLIARPNAMILYNTLAKGPKLPYADQVNSTRHFMRELNRLGITSACDAGGGFRGLPRTAPRPPRPPRSRTHGGRLSLGAEPLAVPAARDLRRVDHPLPERLRGGEPGCAVRRPALVLRPRRDDLRTEHRAG